MATPHHTKQERRAEQEEKKGERRSRPPWSYHRSGGRCPDRLPRRRCSPCTAPPCHGLDSPRIAILATPSPTVSCRAPPRPHRHARHGRRHVLPTWEGQRCHHSPFSCTAHTHACSMAKARRCRAAWAQERSCRPHAHPERSRGQDHRWRPRSGRPRPVDVASLPQPGLPRYETRTTLACIAPEP